jgi:hypothetical protein
MGVIFKPTNLATIFGLHSNPFSLITTGTEAKPEGMPSIRISSYWERSSSSESAHRFGGEYLHLPFSFQKQKAVTQPDIVGLP